MTKKMNWSCIVCNKKKKIKNTYLSQRAIKNLSSTYKIMFYFGLHTSSEKYIEYMIKWEKVAL